VTRAARPLRALGVALLGLMLPACSRSSSDGTSATSALTAPPAPPAVPSLTPEAPSASPTAGPVLTPEDAEEDAGHRITEQNLESELDRLEREIQAE
jgi:hypothetical protein